MCAKIMLFYPAQKREENEYYTPFAKTNEQNGPSMIYPYNF
jgi:hypothetical protein